MSKTNPANSNAKKTKTASPEPVSPNTHIIVTGAREHNLANINLTIPKNQLVVFTGLSGSGKSSLAFDTLYAEGQRRYVESLSSYARQFLGGMKKPAVDQIDGLSPAISIDQKTTSHNPRSTVGTITEIYDYLRLLFARVGHPHCPECGQEIASQSIDQIVNQALNKIEDQLNQTQQPAKLFILSPVVKNRKGEFSSLLASLQKKGFIRARIDGNVYDLRQELNLIKTNKHNIEIIVDRLIISKQQMRDEAELKTIKSRLNQSFEEALKLTDGLAMISFILDQSFDFPEKPTDFKDILFSEKLACSNCGISIKELEPRMFSFNSPDGACPVCHGLGSILKIDPDKILASDLTLSEGAIIPFATTLAREGWWTRLIKTVVEDAGYDFRKTPFKDMSEQFQQVLLYGSKKIYDVTGENRFGQMTTIQQQFEGFLKNLERRYQETNSDFMRHEIERYMRKETCQACLGDRLKPESLAVYIDHQNIADVSKLPISQALKWIETLQKQDILNPKEKAIAQSILKEILARLNFLTSVGLNYLNLAREAATLAGGEAQRIRLASQIGTGLTGVLYILDEPTIGLHQRDNHQLINTLKNLRDKGNSVMVVEHDRDLMLESDYLFDFGPEAGKNGGQVVAFGTPEEVLASKNSLTAKYLARKKDVLRERLSVNLKPQELSGIKTASQTQQAIKIKGANKHNLKGLDVELPLGKLICITGISGSGKSTLLHDTLYANLADKLGKKVDEKPGFVQEFIVPDLVKRVSLIDQSPIGKTPRSNPATYTKIFDYIRKIFVNTKEAQVRGYNLSRFSFNVKGGRCEACQGDGQLKIEMQFLPDVYVTCDVCHGKRYNSETLQVTYQEKNIAEVLNMEVAQAYEFFKNHATLRHKLKTLIDVGLGYIELGQPAPTLSGGEAQRVKLAKELATKSYDHTIYLLDEPTTGLHFADIQKLLNVLSQLVAQGNTVIVIEHNLDIIKNADWIIDLGPEGGEAGGEIVAVGTPEQVAQNPNSFTGYYLKQELELMKK